MNTVAWILVALGCLFLIGLYLSWTAGRLDRLHARIDASRAALDAQLLRRSAVTLELAGSGLLNPATSLLLYATAHAARTATPEEREVAESGLSQTLRAVFVEPEQAATLRAVPAGAANLAELVSAVRRVPMARRFHNGTVLACRTLRRHRVVRYFRLAGSAPFPMTVEIDDEPPSSFTVAFEHDAGGARP